MQSFSAKHTLCFVYSDLFSLGLVIVACFVCDAVYALAKTKAFSDYSSGLYRYAIVIVFVFKNGSHPLHLEFVDPL